VERLREGARAALENGAPAAAADLLERALAEPPPSDLRVEVLREAARAELQAGRGLACRRLEEAMALAEKRVEAELASELAQAYATLFRWTDAVLVLERALGSLGEAPRSTAAHLQSQLVAAGLQDARVAPRALELMKRMSRRRLSGAPAVVLAVAQGLVGIMTGKRADQAAIPLERALASLGLEIENWDLQAALWWSLLLAERFSVVEAALESLRERVNRSGRSRALVAVCSTLGLLKFRLGAPFLRPMPRRGLRYRLRRKAISRLDCHLRQPSWRMSPWPAASSTRLKHCLTSCLTADCRPASAPC
jgi:hypothetical protein